MPKSKRAPALFELINTRSNGKADNKLALPKWFKTRPAAQDRPQANAESPPRPAIPAAPATRPAAPPIEKKTSPPPRPSAKSATESDDSAVRIRTGRLVLSLNPANAVIAGGVLVLALVFTYLLGQAMSYRSKPDMQMAGGPTSVDDVRQALHQPANGQVLEPSRSTTLMGTRSAANQESKSASETSEPDKNQSLTGVATDGSGGTGGPNRIVIESFKAEAEDIKAANHIREWLATQYGLRTELRQFGDRIWLVTQDGFDLEQPGQKEAMNKMIEDLKSLGGTCARELASQKLPVYRLASPYPRRLEK
jgi:hypothetical protein